jgi:hypothetical protein
MGKIAQREGEERRKHEDQGGGNVGQRKEKEGETNMTSEKRREKGKVQQRGKPGALSRVLPTVEEPEWASHVWHTAGVNEYREEAAQKNRESCLEELTSLQPHLARMACQWWVLTDAGSNRTREEEEHDTRGIWHWAGETWSWIWVGRLNIGSGDKSIGTRMTQDGNQQGVGERKVSARRGLGIKRDGARAKVGSNTQRGHKGLGGKLACNRPHKRAALGRYKQNPRAHAGSQKGQTQGGGIL